MAELQSSAAARARSTPRSLLQKRATMQLLLPLLQQSGYNTDSTSMKTMSDIADAALLALWLQRARAAAVAAADHLNFAAAYPAAAAEISSALLHEVPQSIIRTIFRSAAIYCARQIIGLLGWKAAASKHVMAIAPGARAASNPSQVDARRVFLCRRWPRCVLAASQVA